MDSLAKNHKNLLAFFFRNRPLKPPTEKKKPPQRDSILDLLVVWLEKKFEQYSPKWWVWMVIFIPWDRIRQKSMATLRSQTLKVTPLVGPTFVTSHDQLKGALREYSANP